MTQSSEVVTPTSPDETPVKTPKGRRGLTGAAGVAGAAALALVGAVVRRKRRKPTPPAAWYRRSATGTKPATRKTTTRRTAR